MCTGLESDPDYIGHGSMNRSGCYNNNNKFYSFEEWMDGRWPHRHVEKKMGDRASPPTYFVGGTDRQADPRGLILLSCSPGQQCYIGCLVE